MSTEDQINEVFEVLSSFLTNEIYNTLYQSALNGFQQNGKSITDNYRSCLVVYYNAMTSAKNNKLWFNKFISLAKVSFNTYTPFVYISHEQCINRICSVFVPEDFINAMSNGDKAILVYDCVTRVITNVINEITSNYISKIIDNHNDRENIEKVKDSFLLNFANERDLTIGKFIQNHTKSKLKQSVDFETVKKIRDYAEDIQKKYKKLSADYQELQTKCQTYELKIKEINDFYRNLGTRFQEVKNYADSQDHKNKMLTETLNIRDRTISQMREMIARVEAERDRLVSKIGHPISQNVGHLAQVGATIIDNRQQNDQFSSNNMFRPETPVNIIKNKNFDRAILDFDQDTGRNNVSRNDAERDSGRDSERESGRDSDYEHANNDEILSRTSNISNRSRDSGLRQNVIKDYEINNSTYRYGNGSPSNFDRSNRNDNRFSYDIDNTGHDSDSGYSNGRSGSDSVGFNSRNSPKESNQNDELRNKRSFKPNQEPEPEVDSRKIYDYTNKRTDDPIMDLFESELENKRKNQNQSQQSKIKIIDGGQDDDARSEKSSIMSSLGGVDIFQE